MQTDVATPAVEASPSTSHPHQSSLSRQNSVTEAVADLARPHSSKLDSAAARGRLRDALISYVRALRADGTPASDVFAGTNAVIRQALAAIAPARLSSDIRDSIRRWAIAAYDRAD